MFRALSVSCCTGRLAMYVCIYNVRPLRHCYYWVVSIKYQHAGSSTEGHISNGALSFDNWQKYASTWAKIASISTLLIIQRFVVFIVYLTQTFCNRTTTHLQSLISERFCSNWKSFFFLVVVDLFPPFSILYCVRNLWIQRKICCI